MSGQPDASLERMYQEVILDHYRHPHGRGLRSPFDAEVHHVNPVCGDEITLRLRLDAGDGGATGGTMDRIAEVSYESVGCSISQASASVMFDQVDGRPLREGLVVAEEFRRLMGAATSEGGEMDVEEDLIGDGVAFAGVARYPARIKCALLPWMALRDAASRVTEPEPDPTADGSGGTN